MRQGYYQNINNIKGRILDFPITEKEESEEEESGNIDDDDLEEYHPEEKTDELSIPSLQTQNSAKGDSSATHSLKGYSIQSELNSDQLRMRNDAQRKNYLQKNHQERKLETNLLSNNKENSNKQNEGVGKEYYTIVRDKHNKLKIRPTDEEIERRSIKKIQVPYYLLKKRGASAESKSGSSRITESPPPLRQKTTVLWQKEEMKNKLHSPALPLRKSKSPETYRKYFQKSPRETEKCFQNKPKQNSSSRIRDFTSQLISIPGPTEYTKRVNQERPFNISPKNISGIHLYNQSGYYHSDNKKMEERAQISNYPSYKKKIMECHDNIQPKARRQLNTYILYHNSNVPL